MRVEEAVDGVGAFLKLGRGSGRVRKSEVVFALLKG
jgi:hypothetical protein